MKVFAIVLSLLLQQATEPTPKSTIEGTVVRAGSGEPIPGARITLVRAQGPLTSAQSCPRALNGPPTLQSATTDAQGRYVLKDVDVCNYRVNATANGYAKQDYGQRTLSGQGLSIAITAGQTTRNIDITLTPAGNLSGHIRDSTGMAVVGVPVQLLSAVYNPDGQRELQMVAADKTNDRGEYRLYSITPGRYYLNSGSAPGITGRGFPGTGPVSPNQVSSESFTYTFYPGVTDINQAIAIDVPASSEIGGMDMTVSRQQLLSVRGHVVDSKTGLAPPKAELVLYAQAVSGSSASFSGRYNPSDGSFEWASVSPGSYVIQAFTPETVSVAPTNVIRSTFTRPINLARIPLDLTNANVEGIVLTLITGSTLPYRVKLEGTPSADVADMVIRLRPSMNGAISSSANGVTALNLVPAKNSDGSFRIDSVPPGEYRLSTVGLPEDFYLKEARYNSVDVLNNPLKYSVTESGTMDVTVASGAVRISGTALDQKSRPIGGIPVVLIPDLHRDRTDLFLNATTDSNGKFSIRQVPPGDYKLYGWDGETPYSWFDPDLLKKYESQGKPVHVLASSNQTIDVEVLH